MLKVSLRKLPIVLIILFISGQILLSTVFKPRKDPRALPVQDYRLISPLSYQYLINQPDVCKDKNLFLVLMVPVAPQEVTSRDAVRRTWGSAGQDTLTLFYVGLPDGGHVSPTQETLEQESKQYADIIQLNFIDSYQNLTIKTMMMMSWLAAHCPNTPYAMKVDADIFVNVFYLIERLKNSPKLGFITGSVIRDGSPRRTPNSKWYLSEEMYPEDSFPPYVSGAGYVFSSDLAGRISWASKFVRMIPMEDVYVGLCLRVLGVRPVYAHSLLFLRNLFEIQKLKYDRCTFARRVIVNGFKPSELLQVWQDFSKNYASC